MDSRNVEIGERYMITWRNGQKQAGDVIERRALKKTSSSKDLTDADGSQELSSSDYEYYIHFPTFDRRMDEWVTFDRIDLKTGVVGGGDQDEHGNRKRPKRKNEEASSESKEAMLIALEKEHEEITKVKNIQSIVLGKFEIETWYFSPYPEEYCGDEKMYICEFCLKYMKRHLTLLKHCDVCTMKSPPGTVRAVHVTHSNLKNNPIACDCLSNMYRCTLKILLCLLLSDSRSQSTKN